MAATYNVIPKIARGEYEQYPVTASTTLYAGAMVTKKIGYLAALTDGDKFDGHLLDGVINTTAEGVGAAGDLRGKVQRGKYKMQVALPNVNEYMVGAVVYAVDDNTYTLAPMITPVGIVDRYISSGQALVEFDTDISRSKLAGGPRIGIFESFKVLPGIAAASTGWILTSIQTTCGNATGAQGLATPYSSGINLQSGAADNDGVAIQVNGEMFKLALTKPVVYGARVKLSDVTQSDLAIGLVITDVDVLGGVSDGVFFRKADGAATITHVVEKNTTETETSALATLVNDTFVNVGFVWTGVAGGLYPYINGVAAAAQADTNRPDDEFLTPVIEVVNGEGAQKILTVALLDAYQII